LALAHDLRTPLQALSGYASLLEESDPDAPQEAALQELQKSIRALESVLNRTLEARRGESSDG
jgi:signal transduction histidine kinase